MHTSISIVLPAFAVNFCVEAL